MNRDDFVMLEDQTIYFDNAATTLKPKSVIRKMNEYYEKHTSNLHRGEYDAAIKTNQEYDHVRNIDNFCTVGHDWHICLCSLCVGLRAWIVYRGFPGSSHAETHHANT